ncbi:DUF1703 domain containing protein [Elaphomyces granulatus]
MVPVQQLLPQILHLFHGGIKLEAEQFPLGTSDFREIREPSVGFFDKTRYITTIEKGSKNRPRPALSPQKDLNVLKVENHPRTISFDFSTITRPMRMQDCARHLTAEINEASFKFIRRYRRYLGDSFAADISRFPQDDSIHMAQSDIHERKEKNHPLFDVFLLADEYDSYANEYMNPHDLRSWSDTGIPSLLKGFWPTVKSGAKATTVLKEICPLTRADIVTALTMICKVEKEIQEHVKTLEFYANGCHFCEAGSVELVFNTETAISYLEVSKSTGAFQDK